MKKYIFVSLLLVNLVLVGASCGKDEKSSGFNNPFDGKQIENKITDNESRDDNPKVSGDGQTIVFLTDTDKNNAVDSLAVYGPTGSEKEIIKIIGTLMHERSGIKVDSLDISQDGSKVAFIGTPFVENWYSVNPMPMYPYVLDLKTKTLAKIDPQELPEKHYPKEVDAERCDASRVALSNDGSLIAFTCDIWGVDWGEIHDVANDDMLMIANSNGSSEPRVLDMGIHNVHVDMDENNNVYFADRVENPGVQTKFELSVVSADGSGKTKLGINLSYSGFWGITVSNDGRIAGLLADEGKAFVSDRKGNIIAKGDYYYSMEITGDGTKVLAYDTSNKKEKDEIGLVFFNVDDNFSVDQILEYDKEGWQVHAPFYDVSDSGSIVATEYYDNEGKVKDTEILTIYWKD